MIAPPLPPISMLTACHKAPNINGRFFLKASLHAKDFNIEIWGAGMAAITKQRILMMGVIYEEPGLLENENSRVGT